MTQITQNKSNKRNESNSSAFLLKTFNKVYNFLQTFSPNIYIKMYIYTHHT